jgi:antitoxin component of RelBE/YafQ-DinJ toxin-antitoxin module
VKSQVKSATPKTKQIGVVIDEKLHAKATAKCEKDGVDLSEIIRDFLRSYVSNQIKFKKVIYQAS